MIARSALAVALGDERGQALLGPVAGRDAVERVAEISAVTAVSAPRLPHATPSTGRCTGAAARSAASVVPSPPSATTRSEPSASPRGATSCSCPGEGSCTSAAPWSSAHSRRVASARPSRRRGMHDERDAIEGVGVHAQRRYRRAPPCASPSTPALPTLPADLARPRIAGGAGAELLELTSADGTRFSAALAEAPEASGRAVVILPDVRGLYPFYSELAERFAQAGHHADRHRLLRPDGRASARGTRSSTTCRT